MLLLGFGDCIQLVVDFEVLAELHDYLDFAPVCKMEPRVEDLAPYQQHLKKFFGSSSSKKVVPFLGIHRESRRHVALLKFYVEQMGCKILKAHRIWKFVQKPWLQPFMKDQTDKRAAATDEVVRNVLKLGPNSVYGMLLCCFRIRATTKPPTSTPTSSSGRERAAILALRIGTFWTLVRRAS